MGTDFVLVGVLLGRVEDLNLIVLGCLLSRRMNRYEHMRLVLVLVCSRATRAWPLCYEAESQSQTSLSHAVSQRISSLAFPLSGISSHYTPTHVYHLECSLQQPVLCQGFLRVAQLSPSSTLGPGVLHKVVSLLCPHV